MIEDNNIFDEDRPLIEGFKEKYKDEIQQKIILIPHKKTPSKKKNKVKANDLKPENGLKNGKEPRKNKKVKLEEKEETDEHKWWLETKTDNKNNEIKWRTLSHNGVLLAPLYEPINVPLIYNNERVMLKPEAEEVAGFFATMLETDYINNKVFIENFFTDFKKVLKMCGQEPDIEDYEKCDFSLIKNYYDKQKELKKLLTKEEKKKIKEEKELSDEKYSYAILDGRVEKIGNFRVEPPGLFRGRGDHPKTGCLKKRVEPEQIIINIGEEAKVPEPPAGHHWKAVVHLNTVSWLAAWKENVNNSGKYVLFAATSSIKGQMDVIKYEKARKLKKIIKRIRKTYLKELKEEKEKKMQRATAMYLIDRLALRAGNEKGEDEADTVGCCSLRYEHVKLLEKNRVLFDFLGKDSIRYLNEVEVIPDVYQNLRKLKKNKKEKDLLFDRLSTSSLNNHLSSLMAGLSAKVFRTYNASETFQTELLKTPLDNCSIPDKMLAYNRANRQVAVLCNHQKSVSKGFEGQIVKIDDRIKALKHQRYRIKQQILQKDNNEICKKELLQPESDLDDEWIETYLKTKKELEIEKIDKKIAENGKEGCNIEDLEKKKKEIIIENDLLLKEHQQKMVEKSEKDSGKLLANLETLNKKIKTLKISKITKDENKTTALNTSKLNYIDPRITVAWSKLNDVPIDKLFNKSLRDKFKWALDVDKNWKF